MIYIIPWGDINTASTRLRIINILPYLENAIIGIPVDSPDMSCGKNGYTKDDTLIIQKRVALDELKKAKKAGARVIYDIDDKFTQKEFIEMIKKADCVTTDTETKKEWLLTINKKVYVIPDSLDWDGTVKKEYHNNNIIGWVGYGNNSYYLNDVNIPKGLQLRLITDNHWDYYKGLAQSRPWSLSMADKYLSECDFSMYYLPNGDFETCKGEHKLLKSWAIGLPTYTSPIPAYLNAMKKAGLGEKYIVKRKEDWKNLKLECNFSDIEKMRSYALKFKAKNISNKWVKVIKNGII